MGIGDIEPRNERIDFHYLVSRLYVGDICNFTILRKRARHGLIGKSIWHKT